MDISGTGGRVGGTQFDHYVINGLLATEIKYTDHFAPGICPCGKTFRPRRETQEHCSKVCEFNTYALTR